MLPSSQRLNLKTSFKWVREGKGLETSLLRLFYRFGKNNQPLIGVAMTSKVFPKAHLRNRAKRVTFAAFESVYGKLPSGINIVALPKKSVLEVKSNDLAKELEDVLEKFK